MKTYGVGTLILARLSPTYSSGWTPSGNLQNDGSEYPIHGGPLLKRCISNWQAAHRRVVFLSPRCPACMNDA
jgi:hypothetical protein